MLPDIPAEQLADCLDRTAGRLLCRAGVRQPPVDALRMAATLGVEIAIDAGQESSARYVELRAARGGARGRQYYCGPNRVPSGGNGP